MSEKEVVIHIENIKKTYKLGVIGSGTLQGDIQSFMARLRGKEDPNRRVGQKKYKYGETFQALDGIDLDIYKGDTIGIIGRNGAGKSTLLKILSRVTAPTEGRVYVKGRIASMLEVGTGFHRELTGRENVYLNGAIMGMSKEEVDQRMEEIIEFAEIREFMDTPVKRYSSGMYVKLAFSVAAHLNAEILIMDEVLAVGDAKFQKKCTDKITQLAKEEGKTVIFVSHNMNTINNMCNRCAVLDKGKIQYVGDTEKAVELYFQHNYGKDQVQFDLDSKQRLVYEFCTHMEELEFLGKETSEFDAEEKIKGILKWKSEKEMEQACIRVTLSYNGTPVGTYISSVFQGKIQPGEYETKFTMEIGNLMPGTYTAAMGMYRHTEEGIHTPLDYVEDAFTFQIMKGKIENKTWRHRFWGSVLMEEMRLEENKQLISHIPKKQK